GEGERGGWGDGEMRGCIPHSCCGALLAADYMQIKCKGSLLIGSGLTHERHIWKGRISMRPY
ncbi:MAG TPA: hypothetical protein DCL61_06385, partial [Cyanobacteria bacterium UBA12227]|nr:hypothetical protein [Cyanobacteria bacterium UBA12227]